MIRMWKHYIYIIFIIFIISGVFCFPITVGELQLIVALMIMIIWVGT